MPPKSFCTANYCCACSGIFQSTQAFPDTCSLCGAANWNDLPRYPNPANESDFYQEVNDPHTN